MTYMVAAYAVFWLITFALVFAIYHRQQGLQRQVAALRRTLDEREEGGPH
ncbi:MAG: hypothetical protein GX605_10945 [Chloroflexi bacterium]|nr:hypothetical protein [Chloroflexota bacterium]